MQYHHQQIQECFYIVAIVNDAVGRAVVHTWRVNVASRDPANADADEQLRRRSGIYTAFECTTKKVGP